MPRFLLLSFYLITITSGLWLVQKFWHNDQYFCCDVMGYYSYLPSAFIYHNFHKIDSLPNDIDIRAKEYALSYRVGNRKSPKGYYVNQYTCGVALLHSPFFLMAYGYEGLSGQNSTGYSHVYFLLLKIGSICYMLLGIFFLFKSLNIFYSKTISGVVCFLLVFATNVFFFTFFQPGMSHILLFFLYAFLLYHILLFYERNRSASIYWMALVCGLIVLVRPVDIFCVLLPILYGLFSKHHVLTQIRSHYNRLPFALVLFLLPLIPQLILWKTYAGSFFYDSYLGQSFNWTSPKILEGLFGASNGFFAYTPWMLLFIPGMFFTKRIAKFRPLFFIYLPLFIYVTYSWFCYNYIFGFGSRPMIHIYPIMAFGIAALIEKVWQSATIWRLILLLFTACSLFMNFKWSYQYLQRDLWSDRSNFAFNFSTLIHTSLTYDDLLVFEKKRVQPKFHATQQGVVLARSEGMDSIAKGQEYANFSLKTVVDSKQIKNIRFIQCRGEFLCKKALYDPTNAQSMYLTIQRNKSTILWEGISINNKIGKLNPKHSNKVHLGNVFTNEWGEVYFNVKLEHPLQHGDILSLGIWNIAKEELWFRNISMSAYE